MTVAYL